MSIADPSYRSPARAHGEQAAQARAEQQELRYATVDPETAAIRIGFSSVDDLAAQLPERLRGHLPGVLAAPGLLYQYAHQWQSGGQVLSRAQTAARVTELCERADVAAVRRAEHAVAYKIDHTDQLTGEISDDVHSRRIPVRGINRSMRISDASELALQVASLERVDPQALALAREFLEQELGPVPVKPKSRGRR